MISQSPSMNGRWNEAMSKAVHGSPGDKAGRIAMIIDEGCSGHSGAGGRFNRNDGDIGAVDFVQDKRKGNATEVTSPTCARCHDVYFLLPKFLQLFLCLETDDRLVHEHMVQ